ncbi:helix-turn-helix domain-containing protein [Nocardia gipuzkoensis]|jgi:hypothetical protein
MIIDRWTGLESKALREAMLLSIEKFAATTGIAARTVANWEHQGDSARLRPSSQQLLQTALAHAAPEVIARYAYVLPGAAHATAAQHDPPRGRIGSGTRSVRAGTLQRNVVPCMIDRAAKRQCMELGNITNYKRRPPLPSQSCGPVPAHTCGRGSDQSLS